MAAEYVPSVDNTATQHDGTEHLAINNTLHRRWLLLLAIKATRLWPFRQYEGPCLLLSKRLILKTGPYVHLTEAATLQFVGAETSVPVPRVYCTFVHKNQAYIVMERMPGKPLPSVWNALSEADLDSICSHLKRLLDELRSLPPPTGTCVESCVGGSLRDCRIFHCRPRFGPFKTMQEFHLWLREGYRPEAHPDHKPDRMWGDIEEMAARQDGPWPPPVFTHGDLNPSNILVDGNQVVGIVDWETSGWYPHYWEYTSAWYGNRIRTEWQARVSNFLQPHPEELEMEITRQKWWGDF